MAPTDRTFVVEEVKRVLEARGVSLTGACGAFSITSRVAWALRAEGAGLLSKPIGTQCGGFAVDIIAYRDGSYVDCLIDAGGANTPAWQVKPDVFDAARWTAPSDPDSFTAPAPTDPPTPTPAPEPPDELRDVMREVIELLGPIHDALEGNTNALLDLSRAIGALGKSGVRLHW